MHDKDVLALKKHRADQINGSKGNSLKQVEPALQSISSSFKMSTVGALIILIESLCHEVGSLTE